MCHLSGSSCNIHGTKTRQSCVLAFLLSCCRPNPCKKGREVCITRSRERKNSIWVLLLFNTIKHNITPSQSQPRAGVSRQFLLSPRSKDGVGRLRLHLTWEKPFSNGRLSPRLITAQEIFSRPFQRTPPCSVSCQDKEHFNTFMRGLTPSRATQGLQPSSCLWRGKWVPD